jgi:hypothetical protein
MHDILLFKAINVSNMVIKEELKLIGLMWQYFYACAYGWKPQCLQGHNLTTH